MPLSAAARARLDLKRIASLELTPRSGPGRAWLMDAWGWSLGKPAVRPVALPRIDIGRAEVKEGDAGVRTHRVPIRVTGRGTGQVRLFTTDQKTGEPTYRTVTVRPGTQTMDVPFRVRGNTRYGADFGYWVSARALRGTAVGSDNGGVFVRDDDPMPKVTVTPVRDRVTEGQALSWRVTLSEVADTDIWSTLRRIRLFGRHGPHYRARVNLFSHSWAALRAAVAELPDEAFAQPSGCAGWLVRDLVCHLVIDAQDVLITLATPATTEPTADAMSYWSVTHQPPTGDDPLDALIVRLAAAYE